jgi:hypothetical protein
MDQAPLKTIIKKVLQKMAGFKTGDARQLTKMDTWKLRIELKTL